MYVIMFKVVKPGTWLLFGAFGFLWLCTLLYVPTQTRESKCFGNHWATVTQQVPPCLLWAREKCGPAPVFIEKLEANAYCITSVKRVNEADV